MLNACEGGGDAGKVQSWQVDRLRRTVGRTVSDPLPLHDDRTHHELLRGDPQRLSVGRDQRHHTTTTSLLYLQILSDFLSAVANSKEMQSRDFEVMDHFVDTVKQLISSNTEDNTGELHRITNIITPGLNTPDKSPGQKYPWKKTRDA